MSVRSAQTTECSREDEEKDKETDEEKRENCISGYFQFACSILMLQTVSDLRETIECDFLLGFFFWDPRTVDSQCGFHTDTF